MASSTVKRKFFRRDGRPFRGRKRQFVRWAASRGERIAESSVSEWLSGKLPNAPRLERLAREWNPSAAPQGAEPAAA